MPVKGFKKMKYRKFRKQDNIFKKVSNSNQVEEEGYQGFQVWEFG